MQLLTRDGRYEERSFWNPSMQWGSTVPPTNGQASGLATAGTVVSEQSALQLAAVWGSTSLISDSIATLPINQYRLVGGEPVRMDLAQVIEQPWPEMTRRDFITQGTMSFLLRGNLFGKITARDPNSLYPTQVQLVHPSHVKVKRDSAGRLEVYYWSKKVENLDDVTRAMALSVPEGLVGLNPIEYMRNTLGLARAQDLMSGSFFANSARPDGVIQVKGDLDVTEAKKLKENWVSAHQGIGNAYLPAVLTGDATWQPITMSLQDAQFLDQMKFSASVISGLIYRVPPHMLGMVDKETSWGAGIEQQEIGWVRNGLLIWLARWEDLMTSWLPKGEFVAFDLSARLRGDTLQRWSAYQIARVIGAMNNLEIRKEEGLSIPADAATQKVLSDYAAPLNSAPVKPTATGGAGGDKAN